MSRDWTPGLWLDTFAQLNVAELDYDDSWTFQFNYNLKEAVTKDEKKRGWKIYCHCARGKFQCPSCYKRWSSARAVVLFHYRLRSEAYKGTVIMRPFGQACRHCNGEFDLPGFSSKVVEEVLLHLLSKIRKNCYGEEEEEDDDFGSNKHLEEFVQSAGDDGIVVVSFGTLVEDLTREKGNMIASALGQIPQKVLWRYSGKKPDTLAPNTRIYNWIPQNDLLGHPKTRAFVTHGGTNGIYEAIYHGVPMIGIPMFADQPDNLARMKNKGAAVMLHFNEMQPKDLVDALNTVINNSSYKESIMRLSRIHHDQPMKPLDRAVFWIEFVMRHKGAKHLRVQAHNLTWYQYYSLDVFAVLLGSVALAVYIILKTCKYCVWSRCERSKLKNKTE